MDILSHIDGLTIFKKFLVFIFIICYIGYTKLAFISLLTEFEKGISMKNKFIFFLLSFIFTSIGSIFFFYLLLLMIGLFDFDLLLMNINLFIVLNSMTILYCLWKLFLYTSMGRLSIYNVTASMISDERKKLKYLKPED